MKRILVLNFFPAFTPPKSGGELRYFNMYKGLSQYYDITLLSPTYNEHKEEVIIYSETFREYRVPKEDIHNQLHMEIDRENICSEISALVCFLSARTKNRYHELYQELYVNADVIIHEFPYMLNYDMFFGMDDKPRIYNSHNYESDLVTQIWKGPNAEKYRKLIQDAEQTLVNNCEIVFATSEEERCAFSKAFGRNEKEIQIAPNGIDITLYEGLRKERQANKRTKAFFVGSAHPPNKEAVDFILNVVAPACPEIDFYLAGKCSDNVQCYLSNVHLMGLITDEEKDRLFASCDIAVNPMFSGAGTNLKTLEFLSTGIPMISTFVGVRGLGLEERLHYVHAEKEEFITRLKELADDKTLQEKISRAGKAFINQHYSWHKICDSVHHSIESLVPSKESKKRVILAMGDYAVDNPSAGGEIRIHYLLKNMSQSFRVIYLCLSDSRVERIQMDDDFIQISLPKTAEHLEKQQEINSQCWVSANDIVAGNMIQNNKFYLSVAKIIGQTANCIILEQPYMVDAIGSFCRKPVIYDSQNYEYALKKKLLTPHPMCVWLCEETKRLEKKAISIASEVICCSPEEIPGLTEFAENKGPRFDVIRNGVSIAERKYDYSIVKRLFPGKKLAVFIGSGHIPNVDAAGFVIRDLAKRAQGFEFLIIGSVCDAFLSERMPNNVLLMGKVSNEQKDFLLFAADVALNPVEQGAGSNLKLAEYFAYGIPTVTTPFGARGYAIKNGVHAIICERERFAEEMQKMITLNNSVMTMVKEAYCYANEELSWKHLAKRYVEIVKNLISAKRMLFVTYRYNQPPRGGAEVYANNVLNEIGKKGDYLVDIVATEIGDITNRFQYTCDYTLDREIPKTEGNICIRKFPVDTLSTREKWEKCRKLFKTSIYESIKIGRRFVDSYSEPILMGGWFYPEVYEDGTFIWSSGEADIFLAKAISIKLKGRAFRRKEIRLLVDGQEVKNMMVSGSFVFETNLESCRIFTIKTEEDIHKDEDARPLGLYFDEICCYCGNEWIRVDLYNDFRHFLSEELTSEYIDAMIETAKMRPREIDDLFYETRGPLSHEMESWMEANVDNYDIVIGQSVPFDSLVLAQRVAQSHDVPFIALPHFHVEDPFYHWSQYYQALSEANRVIAAPNISKELFYDKIGANAKVLPGGGIFFEEFDGISERLFQEEFNITQPFILILGRKAGGKNYQWVIDAVEEVNQRGTTIQLVMIGRDDDKQQIHSPHLHYIGEQPRDMVLSALKACEFVVNMSESESFGIVILEAWLSGKTVIVNNSCAAFRELVEDRVNGVLVSRDSLPDAIENMIQDERKKQMSEKGMVKAKSYSWRNLSQRIEDLCDEIIIRRKGNGDI